MKLRMPEVLRPAPKVYPRLPPPEEYDTWGDWAEHCRRENERRARVDLWRGILIITGVFLGGAIAVAAVIWLDHRLR